MAKKFVRGITDIKNIEHQDFDTNNVNDLLSDGKHNYIHRKKQDGSEEYHNLTDNIKTLEAVENGLLTVTNYNNTTNSAKLEVHHDQAKSQLLGSPDQTIIVQNGENGSAELTTVDVNPEKVLVHENFLTGYGLSKTTSGNTTTLGLEYTRVENGYDLNNLTKGNVRAAYFTNAPSDNTWYFVSAFSEQQYTIQNAIKLLDNKNVTYRRLKYDGVWGEWREQVGDKSVIDNLLAQKQNTLTSNNSIGVLQNNELRQLISDNRLYAATNGYLKTHVKNVSDSTDINTALEEFNFNLKINKDVSSVDFTLSSDDVSRFSSIFGSIKSGFINGVQLDLNGTTLTATLDNAVDKSTFISFSSII